MLHNRHRPAQSVYLANALLPESDAITIRRQERNANQQIFRLDYEVAQQRTGGAAWLVAAAALLLLHARWRVDVRTPRYPEWMTFTDPDAAGAWDEGAAA